MRVLIACEESQVECLAFRKKGHIAFSCDIKDCSGGFPEWHIKDDVFNIIYDKWDLVIAHPPCTFLTCTGNRWFKEEFKDRFPDREEKRREAINFFMRFTSLPCKHVCIENPVGIMSTIYRKPDQIVQPYQFGDSFSKRTCLWYKNIPGLFPTEICYPGDRIYFKSGKSMPKWYCEVIGDRSTYRSKSFPGIANAMANQWNFEEAL